MRQKEKWINEQCQEIEQNQHLDNKYMHSKIKELSGKKSCTSTNCIKSKDGTVLMDKEDVLNRWSECIGELFKDNRGERPAIKKNTDGPPTTSTEPEKSLLFINEDL